MIAGLKHIPNLFVTTVIAVIPLVAVVTAVVGLSYMTMQIVWGWTTW